MSEQTGILAAFPAMSHRQLSKAPNHPYGANACRVACFIFWNSRSRSRGSSSRASMRSCSNVGTGMVMYRPSPTGHTPSRPSSVRTWSTCIWLCFGGRGWCLHRRCPARPDSTRSKGCDDAGHLEYGDFDFGDFHDFSGVFGRRRGGRDGHCMRGPVPGRKFPSRSINISA